MAPYIGILRSAGIKKESVLGTLATPPDLYLPYLPPEGFSPNISLIKSKSIRAQPDMDIVVEQGPADIKSGKLKMEVDPVIMGPILMAAFGQDTPAEVSSFVVTGHTVFTVTLNTNDYIDFTESGGTAKAAQLTAGTYTAQELAVEIKTQLEATNLTVITYTVSFSTTTRLFTITPSAGTVAIAWLTGSNNAKGAYGLLGFSKVDLATASSQVSDVAVTYADANDAIPFAEGAGAEKCAFLTAGSYKMGADSSIALSLCKEIKTQLESANGTTNTYTVAWSSSTKKLTITENTQDFTLKFSTGVNANSSAKTLMGFTVDATSTSKILTSTGTTATGAWSHTFTRLSSEQLPTYSFWFDAGAKYKQFVGCMLNKFDLDVKAGSQFVQVDTDWTALGYNDAGTSKTPTIANKKPFAFQQVAVTIDAASTLYDNLKITINNNVKADHLLSGSIYPGVIYSEGMEITISADLVLEDAVQYDKFLAGTEASMTIAITGSEYASGVTPYSLTFSAAKVKYSAAPLQVPGGLIKVPFAAVLKYDSGTSYTMQAVLVNSSPSAY